MKLNKHPDSLCLLSWTMDFTAKGNTSNYSALVRVTSIPPIFVSSRSFLPYNMGQDERKWP